MCKSGFEGYGRGKHTRGGAAGAIPVGPRAYARWTTQRARPDGLPARLSNPITPSPPPCPPPFAPIPP